MVFTFFAKLLESEIDYEYNWHFLITLGSHVVVDAAKDVEKKNSLVFIKDRYGLRERLSVGSEDLSLKYS